MLLEVTNASGVAQADYIYLDGQPIAVVNNASDTLYFLHNNMLGTPQLATDSSKAVAWRATYQPFGTASVSGTVTQNLRFPGQYFDVESGWNHNGFRDYIPDLGRYAEPDPLALLGTSFDYRRFTNELTDARPAFPAGLDPFSYSDSNPLSYIDPLGLFKINYHETDTKSGWGILTYSSNTQPIITIKVECTRLPCGQFKASVTVNVEFAVYYGTTGDLEHEHEHIKIAKDFLQSKEDNYSKAFEHNYPDYGHCKTIGGKVAAAVIKDIGSVNSTSERKPDEGFQNFWNLFEQIFRH